MLEFRTQKISISTVVEATNKNTLMVSAFNMKLLSNEFCLKKCSSDFISGFRFSLQHSNPINSAATVS